MRVSVRAPGTSALSPAPSDGGAPARLSEPTTRKFWSPAWAAAFWMAGEFGSRAPIWRTAASTQDAAPHPSPHTTTTRTAHVAVSSRVVRRQVQLRRHVVNRVPTDARTADVAAHSASSARAAVAAGRRGASVLVAAAPRT